jgi:predicted RNA polymerase sigma factor
MELNASRNDARTSVDGEPILLMDQDCRLWDAGQIRRGVDALGRARTLGGGAGFYALQAAIAACHASAPTAEDTDWRTIVGLYSKLSALTGSPVVELNRAVAVAMLEGPAAGLQIVQALEDSPALKGYHMLPSVRGDLLQRLARPAEARAAFTAAAGLTANARERALLERRAAACAF